MAGCVAFIASLSFFFVRFCSDRERSSDPREEKVQKTKSAVFEIAFFLPFFPRDWAEKNTKTFAKKGAAERTFEKREKKTKENDMRLSNFGVPIFSLSLSPSRARARERAFGDKALTFFIFFFFTFYIITQTEPAVRARGAGGRRREKTRRAELFATLERSPER